MDDIYLVWSNEHDGWWKAGGWGYSAALKSAGHYTRDEALDICKRALPTAMHLGRIAEIPVRLSDMIEFMQGEMIPSVVLEEKSTL